MAAPVKKILTFALLFAVTQLIAGAGSAGAAPPTVTVCYKLDPGGDTLCVVPQRAEPENVAVVIFQGEASFTIWQMKRVRAADAGADNLDYLVTKNPPHEIQFRATASGEGERGKVLIDKQSFAYRETPIPEKHSKTLANLSSE